MECPGCDRTLPADATGCECGYQFVAPTRSKSWAPEKAAEDATHGSFLHGLILGFCCGCIGWAIAHFAKLGAKTKEGAFVGWIIAALLAAALELLRRVLMS
jgi:hypothetical protein